MKEWRIFPIGVIALTVAVYMISCAKADPELADAEAALQSAVEAGAPEYAPEEYQEAEDLIRRARELMEQGKHREAQDLLKEARYKAIEAAGKARIAKAQGQMTEEEMMARERELEGMKQGLIGDNIGLQDILFDYDSSDIRADARPMLSGNASVIRENSDMLRVVIIEGYCDTRGTEEYNLALGQRRAESTKAYLVGLGVSPSKLEALSKGETEVWAAGTSEEAYQQNRRAHFVPAPSTPQAFLGN